MPVGFWDMFFDNDYRQREDINELRAQLASASSGSGVVTVAATLTRQVQDLSVLVQMLVRLLEESGHVDGKVLRYRVEAELENMRAAREAAGPTSLADVFHASGSQTAASEPAPPPAPATPTRCDKCGQTVPANRTTITEAGIVCDRCAT